MTSKEFAALVRYKTRTTSVTFPDAEILAYMQARQYELSADIIQADEDIFLVPQYTTLVADQREYQQPSDILARMKRVEAKLDGTNWLKINEMDLLQHDMPTSTEADILKYFSNEEGNAFYDIKRKALYIYSGTITDVTDGLRLWCNTYPATVDDLTAVTDLSLDPTTSTHGMPIEVHEIWARGVIIDWKENREKPIPLNQKELAYILDKQTAIETLMHGNLDREVIAHVPYNDGSEY